MAKIKTGDLVQVISGPKPERGGDRGKQGKVIRVVGDRVLVEGLNLATVHRKVGQTQRGAQTGGIEHIEASIHISNVALVNPDTKAPARVGYEIAKDGTKTRVFKASRYSAKAEKPSKADKADKAADESAAAKKPAAKKAAAEKAADKPAAKKPAAKKPTAEKAADKPAAKKPAAKKAESATKAKAETASTEEN